MAAAPTHHAGALTGDDALGQYKRRLASTSGSSRRLESPTVVILVGKDKKIRYVHKGALSKQDHDIALGEIRKAIHDAGGP